MTAHALVAARRITRQRRRCAAREDVPPAVPRRRRLAEDVRVFVTLDALVRRARPGGELIDEREARRPRLAQLDDPGVRLAGVREGLPLPERDVEEPFAASRLREPHGATLAVVEDVRRLELLRTVTRSPEERLGIATAGRATHPLVDGGAVIDSNDEALTAVASGAVVRGTAWLWGTRSRVSSAGVASRQVVEIDQRALPVVGRGRVHGRKPHVAVARVGLPATHRGL